MPKPQAKIKRENAKHIFKTEQDALQWCHEVGVTLRFTKGHAAAHFNGNDKRKVVGDSLLDAVNELNSRKPY